MHITKKVHIMDKFKLCCITLAWAYLITAVDGSQCQLVSFKDALLHFKAL